MSGPTTTDGKLIVSLWPTEGSRKTFISPNWCDMCTWYEKSVRVIDEIPTPDVAYTTYTLNTSCIIDVYHGKMSGEDFLRDAANNSFRVVVKVNGVTKTEQDPHFAAGGHFTVNYDVGTVTFLTPLTNVDVVTVTYHKPTTSVWTVKPDAGKLLKFRSAEVQFTQDVEIIDSVRFQAYGYVIAFAPHLAMSKGGPLPDTMLIALGNPVIYKTMMDYVNEANGSYPFIEAVGGAGWRGLSQKVYTFPWNYQSMTELSSKAGMEVRIFLEHDAEFGGECATLTIYGLSIQE